MNINLQRKGKTTGDSAISMAQLAVEVKRHFTQTNSKLQAVAPFRFDLPDGTVIRVTVTEGVPGKGVDAKAVGVTLKGCAELFGKEEAPVTPPAPDSPGDAQASANGRKNGKKEPAIAV